jgi:hypothetical protein
MSGREVTGEERNNCGRRPKGLLWVTSGQWSAHRRRLLPPPKRTCSESAAMSAKGHERPIPVITRLAAHYPKAEIGASASKTQRGFSIQRDLSQLS